MCGDGVSGEVESDGSAESIFLTGLRLVVLFCREWFTGNAAAAVVFRGCTKLLELRAGVDWAVDVRLTLGLLILGFGAGAF